MYEKSNFRILLAFICIIMVGLATRHYLFSIRMIQGNSMNPILHDGDFVLVNMWTKNFRQGDIVIFQPATFHQPLIKRILSGPNSSFYIDDYKAISNDKVLSSNKTQIGKNIISFEEVNYQGDKYFPRWNTDSIHCRYSDILKSGPKEFILLGDNRCESGDSRVFGAISSDLILGRVITSLNFSKIFH